MGLFNSDKDDKKDTTNNQSGMQNDDRTDNTGMADDTDTDMDMDHMTSGGGTGRADDRTSGTRMTDEDMDADSDRDLNLRREYTDSDDTM